MQREEGTCMEAEEWGGIGGSHRTLELQYVLILSVEQATDINLFAFANDIECIHLFI